LRERENERKECVEEEEEEMGLCGWCWCFSEKVVKQILFFDRLVTVPGLHGG